MNSKETALAICKCLAQKKAKDIVYIEVKDQSSICDYFVVAGGTSRIQVRSLAENVDEKMEKIYGLTPRRSEGIREGRWAVLDYADVVVHVFVDEERDFYNLERLWVSGNNLVHFQDSDDIRIPAAADTSEGE
ncbi:MAG: ribosome silencing factor [Clostridia bacterium]|nr:ribosome silencing factor [Clostridia bacterium]